jgi:hypothetical protein
MNREIFENSSVNVEVVTSKVLTTFKESSITIERTKRRILKVHLIFSFLLKMGVVEGSNTIAEILAL